MFTLDVEGIWNKNHHYKWAEVERFTHNKDNAFAYLKFTDGNYRIISTKRFRLKGKPLILKSQGRNQTFDNFRLFIKDTIVYQKLDPESKKVQSEIETIKAELQQSTSAAEKHQKTRRLIKLMHQLLELDGVQQKKRQARLGKVFRNMVFSFVLILIVLVSAGVSTVYTWQ